MKKLSLLFVLTFGLFAQAAQDPEQEFVQNAGAVDAALEQAEGAGLEVENVPREDTNKDTNKSVHDDATRTPKNGSRHMRSFLAGLASGVACELACWKASDALFSISSQSFQRNIVARDGSIQTIYGFGDMLGKPRVDVTKCLTALKWAVAAGHVVLPAMLLKKLYKEKKDVKYTRATIATSAALAAVATSLTWTDLWMLIKK